MPDGSLFARLFRVAVNRDGQAAGVEAMAAEAVTAAAAVSDAAPQDSPGVGRRVAEHPRTILEERVAQKVLHAWMQNRYQTLFPLAINLRGMAPAKKQSLLRAMAVAVSAGTPMPQARRERLNAWLTGVGGGEGDRLAFAHALAQPPALPTLVAEVLDSKLAPAAYAISVAALDQGDPVNALYLEYLAAKLGLPVTVVRSANRRYRI